MADNVQVRTRNFLLAELTVIVEVITLKLLFAKSVEPATSPEALTGGHFSINAQKVLQPWPKIRVCKWWCLLLKWICTKQIIILFE